MFGDLVHNTIYVSCKIFKKLLSTTNAHQEEIRKQTGKQEISQE